MDRYLKYGFKYHDIKESETFNTKNFKKIHVNVYSDLPSYTLLSNMREDNVVIVTVDGRVIFKGKDKVVLSNIGVDDIGKCMVKIHSEHVSEFIFEVCNVYYKGVVYK